MECGQYDDHPRHRINDKKLPGGHQLFHLDCCAKRGCPTGTCGPQVELAGGKTGQDLIDHLAAVRGSQEG